MRVPSAACFALVWYSPRAFVYESLGGGAERALAGRGAARLVKLQQAHALGKRLLAGSPQVTYSIYRLDESGSDLVGQYPKRTNAVGAKIRFRERRARLPSGQWQATEDIWRELLERSEWGSIDEAWAEFRRSLELTRDEIEAVDRFGQPLVEPDYPEGEYEPYFPEEEE